MFAELQKRLGRGVVKNEPLAKHTTFRIGGFARYFFEAKTEKEIQGAIKSASDLRLPYFVLGGGSNLLVSDKGLEGLVIKIQNSGYKIENGDRIFAEAGVPLSKIIIFTAQNGLAGLEFLVGIPGTVGGAVYGNAGALGRGISEAVETVRLLRPDGKIEAVSNEWLSFAYRHSKLKEYPANERPVILSAVLRITKDRKENLLGQIQENIRTRTSKEPKSPSAGCVFKNIKFAPGASYDIKLLDSLPLDKETRRRFLERKALPAAWLIEQCGLRGKQIGGAKVAEEHANYIVNIGEATAEQVLQLISLIKSKVRDNFGIQLEEEIQFVGF